MEKYEVYVRNVILCSCRRNIILHCVNSQRIKVPFYPKNCHPDSLILFGLVFVFGSMDAIQAVTFASWFLSVRRSWHLFHMPSNHTINNSENVGTILSILEYHLADNYNVQMNLLFPNEVLKCQLGPQNNGKHLFWKAKGNPAYLSIMTVAYHSIFYLFYD